MIDTGNSNKNILIGLGLVCFFIFIFAMYFVNIKNNNVGTSQISQDSINKINIEQQIEDSLRIELKKTKELLSELESKRNQTSNESNPIQKITAFGNTWVFVCYGEYGDMFYIKDEDPYYIKSEKMFYGNVLCVFDRKGNLTDQSIIAKRGYAEYNIAKKTQRSISNTLYYENQPSKFGYTGGLPSVIPDGSVSDFVYQSFVERLK